MQQVGGSHPAEGPFTVEACLQRLSDDTRIPVPTLERRRWVASRWPAERRRDGVPYVVYSILAGIAGDEARWAQLDDPPLNERTGRREWTQDGAKRIVGQKVGHPITATEKVKAIHDMATDEQVAARAVTDLLRRPEVAFQAMGDEVAKHLVNRAQIDRSMQAAQVHRRPAEPALRRVQAKRRVPEPDRGVLGVRGRHRAHHADAARPHFHRLRTRGGPRPAGQGARDRGLAGERGRNRQPERG